MLSRLVRIGTTVVVLGLMTTSAFAQPGGRGGRGGGFGRQGGGASDLMGMLASPEVRKEVKLSDEGYAAIEKLQKEIDAARQAMFSNFRGGGGGGQNPSDADREKMRADMEKRTKENNEKSQAMLDEVLPPEGLDRLMGLYVQWRGDASITGELISKKLGLSEADKTKINDAVQKVREEAMAAFRPQGAPGGDNGGRGNRDGGNRDGGDNGGRGGRGAGAPGGGPGGPGGFDPQRMQTMMAEMQKKTNDAVAGALTDPQKQALADLKGAKFTIPESLNRGFGGFGGPGGPGGGPGGAPQRPSN